MCPGSSALVDGHGFGANAVTLITDSGRVRFTTPGAPLEWRLEIANAQNESIFDSGPIEGNELDWPLIDAKGQLVDSGLYTYTLTIRSRGSEPRIQRGQLQIERARSVYHINSLNDSTDGVILTSTDAGTPPATTPDLLSPSASFRRSLSAVSFAVLPLISGSGTTNTMTKWIDGPSGVVGDTNVTEVNGSVVIGNDTFKGNLQIYGPPNRDVFAGMGPNLLSGPAFTYGYAGESIGRSVGFINVRPDPSAVPPNPSLWLMTGNLLRMMITNSGKIGIGPGFALGPPPIRTLQILDYFPNAEGGTLMLGANSPWTPGIRRIVKFGQSDS